MATRYLEQATQQLAPVYDQQIQSLQGQIPAIQNLYNTLTQALQQSNTQQLNTGVQNISEDASRRGVLRSTLPVDSRQALTAELGAALMQGMGQLGLQQTRDVAGVQEKIGGLNVNRAQAIAELSRSLEDKDLEREKFEFQKQASERDFQLERQKVSSSNAKNTIPTLTKNSRGGWDVGGGMDLAGYARSTGTDLITLLLQGDAQDRQAANWYLAKINKYGTKDADKYFQELQRDRPTAFYRGG